MEEAATRLRGPEGTSVTLTVQREGEPEDLEVMLTRREIVTKSVPYSFVGRGRHRLPPALELLGEVGRRGARER